MDLLLNELVSGLPDATGAARIIVRMLMAAILGSLLGFERQRTRKAAGLRTHMLVALGSALFVLAPLEAGMPAADVSRIVQGVAAGIGFIGAGAILKLTGERHIQGLTTAASIWMTAAVGMTAGLGRFSLGLFAALLAWITLSVLGQLEAGAPPDDQ